MPINRSPVQTSSIQSGATAMASASVHCVSSQASSNRIFNRASAGAQSCIEQHDFPSAVVSERYQSASGSLPSCAVAIPAAKTMQMPIERFIFSIARPNMFRCAADRRGIRVKLCKPAIVDLGERIGDVLPVACAGAETLLDLDAIRAAG